MARITQKQNRRYRMQFTMRRELHEIYEACLAKAGKLCLVIDFSHDFDKWFKNQLEQVELELDRLEAEQSALSSTHAADQPSDRLHYPGEVSSAEHADLT